MTANSTMSDLFTGLMSQPSMESDLRPASVKAAVKGTCTGTTTDKQLCGTNCKAEPLSVFAGLPITLYACLPTKIATNDLSTIVIDTTITTTYPTPFVVTSTTSTRPKSRPAPTTSTEASVESCGATAREASACPTQCPVSVIPGGVGAVYSCVDPSKPTSSFSTPATVSPSRTTGALTFDTSSPPAANPTADSTPTLITVSISSFETSVISTVTQVVTASTNDAAASSTPPAAQNQKQFAQTTKGKAAIAASLVGGLVILGLAVYLWRRRKRMMQARHRSQTETIQLRCDVGASGSDVGSETRRNLSIWEILTNTTREEYHAQRAEELRRADRAAMTARQQKGIRGIQRGNLDPYRSDFQSKTN